MFKAAAGALLALVIFAHGAEAALHSGALMFGPEVGVAIPTGEGSGGINTAFWGGAVIDHLISSAVALGGDLNYNHFGIKTTDGNFNYFQFGAHSLFILPLEGSGHPYFKVGMAGYHVATKTSGYIYSPGGSGFVTFTGSETDFGFNAGVGVIFDAGSTVRLGVESLYHDILAKDGSTQYASFRVRLLFGQNRT